MKEDRLTWIRGYDPRIARPSSRLSRTRLTIPARSSSVSVGNPTMKYILTSFQPPSKAKVRASRISRASSFLLITARRRSVPASGTRVNPVLRTLRMFSTRSRDSFPGRSEERDREIFSRDNSSMRQRTVSSR
jgi:hypothetical protein